jgi:ornithine cyclodeaminase/alanine dehydrogenase
MARAVAAVEQALVTEARGRERGPRPPRPVLSAGLNAIALAAAGAIASRFLAVGTPRSIGLVGASGGGLHSGTRDAALAIARASLTAHRVLFAPTDVRCADTDPELARALAAELGGRAVSLEQACAADIVCLGTTVTLPRHWLRGGTHVNALAGAPGLDPAILADAMLVVDDQTDLGPGVYGSLAEIAAGYKDGRQLDEISLFIAGSLTAPRRAIAELVASLPPQP